MIVNIMCTILINKKYLAKHEIILSLGGLVTRKFFMYILMAVLLVNTTQKNIHDSSALSLQKLV
jgi:hypothetical protein